MKKTKRVISIVLSALILTSIVTIAPFSVNAAETEINTFANQTGKYSDELSEDSTEQSAEETTVKSNEPETDAVPNEKEKATSNKQQSEKIVEPVGAAVTTEDGFTYTFSGTNATITRYSGFRETLVVPETIDGYLVISIGQHAFANNSELERVVIPGNVKRIDSYAFANCSSLSDIELLYGIEELGDNMLSGCNSLRSISLPESTKRIGSHFIENTNITSITIPKNVTSAVNALYDTPSLQEVIFEDGIVEIPSFICGSTVYQDNSNIRTVYIPDTVKSIGQHAFSRNTKLEKLVIPGSVKRIDSYAFADCSSLNDIELLYGIEELGDNMLSGCNSLRSISLPESTKRIGSHFIENTNITSITIPKNVTSAVNALYDTPSLQEVIFEDGIVEIPSFICGSTVYQDNSNIRTVYIPDTVKSIGQHAFSRNTKLEKLVIPESVKKIESYAFADCPSLILCVFEYSYAEDYAISNNLPFLIIADEDTFIQKHLEFIGAENSNNTYHNQLQYCDLAEIALEDYGDLNDTYNLWRAIRGEIFDNPYYTVLSDMILSESAAQGQIESFDIHLDSEWRSVANDIIELINSKVDLTPSQESKIKKMFKKGDFTDETTFKFCQDILGNKVSKEELNSIFNVYDKTNTFLDVFNQGADIVESVYDTMNYSAILKAYEKTSDEFKVVLMQMAYTCQTENPWLYTAIDKYLKSDYDTEMRNKIVEEVAKNGLSIGKALFKSSIENKIKAFLINNMDLSKVGTSVATKVLAFVEGCKIGYAIGTGIDNLLFSTDDVSNSFVAASATAKTAGYLKYVLETNESNLRNNPTIKNAVLFCETYNMYKNIQLHTADTMIKYFSKNQTSLINRIFQSNNILYEHQIYNWQILKLNWQNASCHKGYILNSKLKNVTVACPVDVTVYTSSGEIALQITDSVVEKNNGDVIATVCNNIKYITLPDDSYSIKITATENGTMTYSITDYNSFDNSSKTICFNNIPIAKDNEFTGNIVSGSDYSQNDISLYSNDETVESEVSEFTNESIIEVESINLSSNNLSLKTGETKTLSAVVEPSNASIKTVSWYSDDSTIAQVDEYGNVKGVSAGITRVYCVSLEGNVVVECEITVYGIGDANLDGSIDIRDVTAIQRHIAELEVFTDEQIALADTNGDGVVNIADATHLQMYLAEYDVVLGKA